MKKYIVKSLGALAVSLVLAGCVEDKLGDGGALKGIELESETFRVRVESSARFHAYPVPWNCTDYKFQWSSSNPEVASVNSVGLIEGNDVGTATITVSQDGISKSFPVEIYENYEETLAGLLEASRVGGAWLFEDASNLQKATFGKDLVAYTQEGKNLPGLAPSLDGFTQVAGPSKRNKAVHVPFHSYFFCDHGFPASSGGVKVNEWTLLVDFIFEKSEYHVLFEADNLGMNGDADFFINGSGEWGIQGNYSNKQKLVPNQWYRMVITADFVNKKTGYYLNGALIDDSKTGIEKDGRHAWQTQGVILFGDADYDDDHDFDVSTVAIWNRVLTADEVKKLGSI
jgi:hypothetical protein